MPCRREACRTCKVGPVSSMGDARFGIGLFRSGALATLLIAGYSHSGVPEKPKKHRVSSASLP